MEKQEAAEERLAKAKGWKCELCGDTLMRADLGIERGGMTVCPNCMHRFDKMLEE